MGSRDEVPCPVCGELILAVARKCKHCGEWLQDSNSSKQRAELRGLESNNFSQQSNSGKAPGIGVMMVAIGFLVWFGAVRPSQATTSNIGSRPESAQDGPRRTATPSTARNGLAPATQAMKDACAREASGGFNYSASEIAQYANDIPDIAVAYAGCVMRRRQAGY